MTERRPQTRRQRLEQKEQAIVSAAHEVFMRNGFDGARIAEIARRAGMAEGTVYLYFENKNALAVAVLGAFYDRLTREAAEGVGTIVDTFARLDFLARHHLENIARVWPIFALLTHQYRFSDDYGKTETYQFNRTYVAVFDQVIREGIIRGDIRDDVPLSLIRDIFYGGLEYAGRTTLLRTKTVDPVSKEVVGDFLRILTTGMAVQPAADRSAAEKTSPLGGVTTRLEQVATRLEQAASGAATQNPGAGRS